MGGCVARSCEWEGEAGFVVGSWLAHNPRITSRSVDFIPILLSTDKWRVGVRSLFQASVELSWLHDGEREQDCDSS